MGKSIHSTEGCVHIKYFNYGVENDLYVEADNWSAGLQRFRQIYGEDNPGKFYVMSVGW
ncbi:hypothetical protein [Bacillus sp. M6-12]|uniref:hypothetical protein n=1 Tax=Bacillus sp. M6-12 TaxID=2054166 RepID=UPI0015E0AECA|nr:hypothetical protein [Bacillus sp. M6-12]